MEQLYTPVRQDNDTAQSVSSLTGPGILVNVTLPLLNIVAANQEFEKYFCYQRLTPGTSIISLTELFADNNSALLLNLINSAAEAPYHFVVCKLKSLDGSINPYYIFGTKPASDNDKTATLLLIPGNTARDLPFISLPTKEVFLEQFTTELLGTFEWMVDDNTMFWSAGMYRLFELTPGTQVANIEMILQLIHPAYSHVVEQFWALTNGIPFDHVFKVLTESQNVKVLHCVARPTNVYGAKKLTIAGSIRDITARYGIEESLKSKVEALNHSNRELEEFAYVASHDLQEPLRKITTFSDRLSEKYKNLLTGDGQMYLSRIIASAENMRALIKDLLEFSRISKTEPAFESVSLDQTLKQVKSDLELIIEETGTVIISDHLPTIEAIPTQMKQLFSNIINNAIKFRKPDVPPVIIVHAGVVGTAEKRHYDLSLTSEYFKIQITDNGIGFEEEYASRIFQVFQRLHGKSEYPGSGVGLAICKKIIEYHTGIIFAENLSGEGARFVFILPEKQQKHA